MLNLKKMNSQNGQVLLVVILASVIALTVGLAAISRSITNTRISTEESNSQKALSAAEAGVEEQLKAATDDTIGILDLDPVDLDNNSSFDSAAVAVDGQSFELNGGDIVDQDEGADIWLSTHPDFSDPKTTTDLTIYWSAGSADCNDDPAIEVAVIQGSDRDNPSMVRYAFDGCSSRATNNGFDSNVSDAVSGDPFEPPKYHKKNTVQIPIADGYIARVIPLYEDANIAVVSDPASLPLQGYNIESVGKSGNTVRKVKVFQGFSKLPVEFFPYNLFLP